MWKFDYHIHTVWSDGASKPEDIVRIAAELGMDEIAITDHDGIDGVQDAIQAGKEYGLRVIPGIEIDTRTADGTGLHILGYGFDPQHPALVRQLEYMSRERVKRNEKLIRVLRDAGCDISYEELRQGRRNDFIGKPVIARALRDKGYVKTWEEAFRSGILLGSPAARAIRKTKVDTFEAVKTILAAEGKPVLAHPIQAKKRSAPDDEVFYEKMDRLLGQLKDAGLYGLECYHPDQDARQTMRFLDLAEKYDLRVSRGTDFHGEDYHRPKQTADYLATGGSHGYGILPEDFVCL